MYLQKYLKLFYIIQFLGFSLETNKIWSNIVYFFKPGTNCQYMIENSSRFYYFIRIRIYKIGRSRPVYRGRIIIIGDDCCILYNGTKHARHGRWAPSLPPHHLHHHIYCTHLYWCCYCFCCGAHASIAGVLVTSTPAEDASTRTTWINRTERWHKGGRQLGNLRAVVPDRPSQLFAPGAHATAAQFFRM